MTSLALLRCQDPRTRDRITAHATRLLDDYPPSPALATITLDEVLDRFWPAKHGWVIEEVEHGTADILTIAAHPDLGTGITLLPELVHRTQVTARPVRWQDVSHFWRSHAMSISYHAQAATRLDILAVIADRTKKYRTLTYRDALAVNYLIRSPAFLDEQTSVMLSLGAHADLLAVADEVATGNVA